ncbi:MAG: hypothetical protein BGP05_01660 [Rhizobiales bacterium 62-47]|nr:hypothetical protein [Hyphomicrobiales bacterium]OJY12083.1 MAG: hypothetical protein BGP05_01660 [Rhizobiales bacterium 62-47]
MTIRNLLMAALLAAPVVPLATMAAAQDVPGIEICTVEKDMVRRTSCLQSNIDFLKKTATQAAVDSQRKIDAANRQIEALKATVAALQKSVEELQAAQKKLQPAAPAKDDAAKDAPKDATKDESAGAKK